ncbi:MAG: CinA family protein [Hyphomicrobium sp.]|jgi:nicotinamide-nucleotide amidase
MSAAEAILEELRRRSLMLTTAESCTGGLIAALMTEIAGASDVFERGFVTYSNRAKIESLGVPLEALQTHGAVSSEVARAMAEGALRASAAEIAVAVTGVAGPQGGTAEKPVGLVHIGLCRKGGRSRSIECRFGDIGRSEIRLATVEAALRILAEEIANSSPE